MSATNNVPVVTIGCPNTNLPALLAAIDACNKASEAFVYFGRDITIRFDQANTNTGAHIDFTEMFDRYMEEIEPVSVKQQSFWTQGRKKKGGRNKYGR